MGQKSLKNEEMETIFKSLIKWRKWKLKFKLADMESIKSRQRRK